MSDKEELVLTNAVLWARHPMTRFQGGLRINSGTIREIFNQKSPTQKSTTDPKGMHVIPGLGLEVLRFRTVGWSAG